MRLPRMGIIALVTFLIVILTANWGFSFGSSSLPANQVQESKPALDWQFNVNLQFPITLSPSIYWEIGDRQGEGKALNNLGIAYDSLGDYPRAIEYFQQQGSAVLAQSLDEQKAEADRLLNIGIRQGQSGQAQAAIQFLQRALTIYLEIEDRSGAGLALVNLGNVHIGLGNYNQAIDYMQQSLAIFREIENSQGEQQVLHNLGAVAFRLLQQGIEQYEKNKVEEALQFCQQALTLSRQIGNYHSRFAHFFRS